MSIFAIGDTHLSLGAEKPMDIFSGWQDYVQRIETNWRRLVEDKDTVVIPGDVSWALNLPDTKADFEFLNSLPGTKIISKGNHDYWWSTKKKMDEYFAENGFDTLHILHNNAYAVEGKAICGARGWFFDDSSEQSEKIINRECGRLRTSISAAKDTGFEPVVFLHYPPISNDKICEPIMEVLVSEGIKRCYFAHLHGASINYAFRGEYEGISFSLVSSDSLGFCPMLIP